MVRVQTFSWIKLCVCGQSLVGTVFDLDGLNGNGECVCLKKLKLWQSELNNRAVDGAING